VPPPQIVAIENVQDDQVLTKTMTITPIIDSRCPIVRAEFQLDGQAIHGAPQDLPWILKWDPEEYVSEIERRVLTIIIHDAKGETGKAERIVRLPGRSTPLETGLTPPVSPTGASTPAHTISIFLSQLDLIFLAAIAVLIIFLVLLVWRMSFLRGRLAGNQSWPRYEPLAPSLDSNHDDGPTEPMPVISDINTPSEKMPTAYLRVIDHPHRDKIFDIDRPIIRLGRVADENDIALSWDKKISRVHAQIEYRHGCFYLWDFSKNGTFVNGKRLIQVKPDNLLLDQATLLEDGAEIKVGERVRLMFHYKHTIPTEPC
jgi:hypothetical protein